MLRIESGLIVTDYDYHAHERTPFDFSFDKVVAFAGSDFNGEAALRKVAPNPPRRFKTLVLETEELPEYGAAVTSDGEPAGTLTSPTKSPRFGQIGLAILESRFAGDGQHAGGCVRRRHGAGEGRRAADLRHRRRGVLAADRPARCDRVQAQRVRAHRSRRRRSSRRRWRSWSSRTAKAGRAFPLCLRPEGLAQPPRAVRAAGRQAARRRECGSRRAPRAARGARPGRRRRCGPRAARRFRHAVRLHDHAGRDVEQRRSRPTCSPSASEVAELFLLKLRRPAVRGGQRRSAARRDAFCLELPWGPVYAPTAAMLYPVQRGRARRARDAGQRLLPAAIRPPLTAASAYPVRVSLPAVGIVLTRRLALDLGRCSSAICKG